MKETIQKIEEALRRLYNFSSSYSASDFLTPETPASHGPKRGALLLSPSEDTVEVGIYLSEQTGKILQDFAHWNPSRWTHRQLSAFSEASEEVSHFHYWLFHSNQGRSLSELEMELQAEVDKFFLAYFANAQGSTESVDIEKLYSRLFENFRFAEGLSTEQKDRYEEANSLAKSFVSKSLESLQDGQREKVLAVLRKFYRLNLSEKCSFILSLK